MGDLDVSKKGYVEGYGSVFNVVDSYGDVVMPGAFRESIAKGGRNKTGVLFLWQHDPKSPIGKWIEMHEDEKGLRMKGKLTLNTKAGNEAYALLKDGAIQGLSIGYDTSDHTIDPKTKIRYLKKISLWETSLVSFPANTEAIIDNVKNDFIKQEVKNMSGKGIKDILVALQNLNTENRKPEGKIYPVRSKVFAQGKFQVRQASSLPYQTQAFINDPNY